MHVSQNRAGRGLALAILAGSLTAIATTGFALSISDAAGNWKHPDTGAIISFFDCGGDLCGKIMKPSEAGLKDAKNPEASKREQPLEGLTILDHAKKSDEGSWKGDLYNAEDGKTYAGYVTLQAAGKLQLKGCALMVFCKSIVFSKVEAP